MEFVGHKSGVNTVAFSRDSSTIVSGSGDNTVRLWKAATGVWAFAAWDEGSGPSSAAGGGRVGDRGRLLWTARGQHRGLVRWGGGLRAGPRRW